MVKRISAWFHLWVGLASGIIVFILSITGCLLVFKQEIKSLSSSWLHTEKKEGQKYLPPSVLYKTVQEAMPGKEIGSVWYHGENRTAHFTVHGSDSLVYVNPYNGEVVAMKDHEDFFHFIDEGHTSLWLPRKIGVPVVSWATLIFFLLLLTGIVLWWPKRWNKKGVEQAFTVKWKSRFKRLNYDLHNVLGFYSLIVAILFAFTGLMMGFAWFSNSVYWLTGGETKQRTIAEQVKVNSGAAIMLDQVDKAWLKGMNEIGQINTDDIIVSFPDEPSEPIYVCVDMHMGTWRDVYLDQHTLQENPNTQVRLKDTDLASKIRRINYGLHVGEIGGLTTKIIYFFASLICASLPVTGFLVWWGKRKKTSAAINRNPVSLTA